MKLITLPQDPTVDYSTRMSTGDYVPYAHINTCERVFDVQGKAGEPNILLFLKDSHLELTARALQMRLPFRHFVFTRRQSTLSMAAGSTLPSFVISFSTSLRPSVPSSPTVI